MKTRHLLLGAGLIVATGLAIFGDREPDSALSEPAKPGSPIVRESVSAERPFVPTAGSTAGNPELRTLALTPPATKTGGTLSSSNGVLPLHDRQRLIGRSNSNTASVLFAAHSWSPPPPPPPAALPPAPPTAPPLPFTYLGKSKETDQWQVFLTRQNVTFIVKENDVIENEYRVQQINPPSMTLVYLPLKQTQSLTIE